MRPEFQPSKRPSAKSLQWMWEQFRKWAKLSVSPPLFYDKAANVLRAELPEETVMRITGGSQPYAWQAIQATSSGGWQDVSGWTGTTSTDPAYERNGNGSVTLNTRVFARRDPSTGFWIFDAPACVGGQPTTPSPPPSPGPISPPTPTLPPATPPPAEPPPSDPPKDDPIIDPPADDPTGTGPYEPIWSYPDPFAPWDPWGNPIYLPINEQPMTTQVGGISITPPPPQGVRATEPTPP